MLALESNLKPIVGQQITLTASNAAVAGPRVDLLVARADAGDCDLVVKGWSHGDELGFLYTGDGRFDADRARAPRRSDGELRWLATRGGGELTYTCVPPGSGERIGVDRDGDGARDGAARANTGQGCSIPVRRANRAKIGASTVDAGGFQSPGRALARSARGCDRREPVHDGLTCISRDPAHACA
jgi:hypothetical protein